MKIIQANIPTWEDVYFDIEERVTVFFWTIRRITYLRSISQTKKAGTISVLYKYAHS